MKKRPIWLKLFAIIIFLIPIGTIFIFWLGNHHFFFKLPTEMRIEFLLLIVGGFISALGVWRAKTWGFRFFLIYAGIIVVADLVDYMSNPARRNTFHLVDWILCSIGFGIIFRKRSRDFFFNKARRWWERATRIDVNLDAIVKTGDKEFDGKMLNISQTGCLILLSQGCPTDENLLVAFTIKDKTFEIPAEIARIEKVGATTFGLKFKFVSVLQRLDLGIRLKF